MRTALPALTMLHAALTLPGCAFQEITASDTFAGCCDQACVSAPVLVAGAPPLVSLSTKTSHTCGLTAAGEAWCWALNLMGKLGLGTRLELSATLSRLPASDGAGHLPVVPEVRAARDSSVEAR